MPEAIEAVRTVWRDVLEINEVGDDDNFFFLGGHSLLVLEAVERLDDLTGVEVPLRLFFDEPTPAAIAAYISRNRA